MLETKLMLEEERDFGEKLNSTFTFIAQNFRALFGAVFYISAPAIILSSTAFATIFASYMRTVTGMVNNANMTNDPFWMFNDQMIGIMVIVGLLFYIAYQLIPMVVVVYMKLYNQQMTTTITTTMVWNEMRKFILPILFFQLILLVITIIGFAFLIIPGIYLSGVFMLFNAIYINEELGFASSVKRCFELIKDKWLSTFGLFIVSSIIVSLVSSIIGVPVMMLSLASTFLQWDVEKMVTINMIGTTVNMLFRLILLIIPGVAMCLQYYNLKERQDGDGIKKLMSQIGTRQQINEGEY
ncbi:MAG: hypothetical protein IPO27_01515 [Bacteroidetes bacterium]|nr:hypothetical protein [Bacteroidota bacterium]